MPTTEQKTGQTTGDQTSAAADNAADFRYDSKDFALARLRIIGDPAWIQEDKVDLGVGNQTFNFRPFNDDGGINFNSQELVFDVTWNNPQDYDMETGIMDVYPQGGRSKEYLVYTVKTVKSFFSRGRFEQELEGQQLVEYNTGPKPAEVRPPVQQIKKKPAGPPDRSREYALKGFKGTDLPPVGTDTVGAFVGYRSPGIRRKTLLDPKGYGDA